MADRRKFIKQTALGTTLLSSSLLVSNCESPQSQKENTGQPSSAGPIVISTWNNLRANSAAWSVLSNNGKAIDAVEAGVRIPEADANDQSVGYGGRPDREGKVTCDACIMNSQGDYGAVVFLEDIIHPVSVARLVMDETPHVMLAGVGARQFAIQKGFKPQNMLTPASKKEWEDWLVEAEYKPIINIENHDTIGMLVLDADGNLSGACTTSGLAYKMRGRVGDSPLIGAGLFVDNEIGAATATGLGEKVVKTLGSFRVVEYMRQGHNPEDACRLTVEYIKSKSPDHKEFQIGFVAMDKSGRYGGFGLQPGFGYAFNNSDENQYFEAGSLL